ncbi:MAG: hypothetical protein KDB07_09900, partial [Planctomycetes bacterium]|nr:hypothetical protein [Planctomycetota bacterium]
MQRLAALLLVVLALVLSLGQATQVVHAQDYDEAKSRNNSKLKSEKASERAEAVEDICMSGDPKAVKLAISMMKKEDNPFAGQRMGHALRHMKSAEAIAEASDEIAKLKGRNDAFAALWAMSGILMGKTEEGDKVVNLILAAEKIEDEFQFVAALESIAAAKRSDMSRGVEYTLQRKEKDWEKDPLILLTACSVASRINNSDNVFKLVLALADTLQNYEHEKIQRFAASACA